MFHSVELLALALSHCQSLGYTIREEFLGGVGGGACELRGRKYLFLDLALRPSEQLEQVCEALRDDPQLLSLAAPVELRPFLACNSRKAG